jgi:hypothetical protein
LLININPPAFLWDTETKSESQQVKAYELRVYENMSLKTSIPQAIIEIRLLKNHLSTVKSI